MSIQVSILSWRQEQGKGHVCYTLVEMAAGAEVNGSLTHNADAEVERDSASADAKKGSADGRPASESGSNAKLD